MFSRMYLEITTCCNLSCSFCPGTKRPAAFLSPEDFRTLAAKLRPYGQYLYLHVMGEPLLHPQLPELLEICRALGFRAFPSMRITDFVFFPSVIPNAFVSIQNTPVFPTTIWSNSFTWPPYFRDK